MQFPRFIKYSPRGLHREYSSNVVRPRTKTLPQLPHDYSVKAFRRLAFAPELPALFPYGSFASIPAITKWFQYMPDTKIAQASLNMTHLLQWKNTKVPVEVTLPGPDGTVSFQVIERPLGDFLALVEDMQQNGHEASAGSTSVYIAQCSHSSLPKDMRLELPTPKIVLTAGRGDLYGSSIWIGLAPTYTPLHKDPNPNVFVQLAGQKTIRLFEPQHGSQVFEKAKTLSGSRSSESIRGVEMMQGRERQILEDMVWGDDSQYSWVHELSRELTLGPGDGAFIPKGWWHSVQSIGNGVVGSVNWWFR